MSAGRRCRALGIRRAGFGLLLAAAGCSSPAARFATTDPSQPVSPRRAPGIAVDPESPLPSAAARARSDSVLTVLASPPSLKAARTAVASFFDALVTESPERIDAVLTEQAFLESASGRQPARGALRSRFLQLDYSALRGMPLYREREVEVYRPEEIDGLRSERALSGGLERDQLYVRVHLNLSYAGKTRLLADEIGFVLRRNGDGYRIAAIREDTPVP